jgi:hypothetical protein
MPKYWITYETTASLMYLVEATSEEEAKARWQDNAQFDFDRNDFVDGAAGTSEVQLRRLEMLEQARNFEITEAPVPVSR